MIIPVHPNQLDLITLSMDESTNGGKPICYLMSTSTLTMWIQLQGISNTVKAYLAFHEILRADGQQAIYRWLLLYNSKPNACTNKACSSTSTRFNLYFGWCVLHIYYIAA